MFQNTAIGNAGRTESWRMNKSLMSKSNLNRRNRGFKVKNQARTRGCVSVEDVRVKEKRVWVPTQWAERIWGLELLRESAGHSGPMWAIRGRSGHNARWKWKRPQAVRATGQDLRVIFKVEVTKCDNYACCVSNIISKIFLSLHLCIFPSNNRKHSLVFTYPLLFCLFSICLGNTIKKKHMPCHYVTEWDLHRHSFT